MSDLPSNMQLGFNPKLWVWLLVVAYRLTGLSSEPVRRCE
jgi:hypothetical protein